MLGGVALVLAVVGVYGVPAFSIIRRAREIGIRVALGVLPAWRATQVPSTVAFKA